MKASKIKRYRCDSAECNGIEYEIRVEPSYELADPTEEQERWLVDACFCPACGGDVEEI